MDVHISKKKKRKKKQGKDTNKISRDCVCVCRNSTSSLVLVSALEQRWHDVPVKPVAARQSRCLRGDERSRPLANPEMYWERRKNEA